jgi:hypothetical protein
VIRLHDIRSAALGEASEVGYIAKHFGQRDEAFDLDRVAGFFLLVSSSVWPY